MATEYAYALASVAVGEHQAFAGALEADPRLYRRIYETYLPDLSAADPRDPLGWRQSDDIASWAWSAAFVSWCALKAGATIGEFDLSIRHAAYIKKAVADASDGAFRAQRIEDYAPDIGDIICANRGGGRVTYDEIGRRESFFAHGAIVVELFELDGKRYAVTIGAYERDSLRRTDVELTRHGTVRQRRDDPYICVIQTAKADTGFPRAVVRSDAKASRSSAGAERAGPTELPDSLRGHGTFVHDAVATIEAYGSAERVARTMKRAEMGHAWIRIHGRRSLSPAQKRATEQLLDACARHDIAVAGWCWCQGEDAAAEARTAVKELDRFGVRDFVANIEAGCDDSVWTVTDIAAFCETLKERLSGSFAISSFGLIDWHQPHLMRAAASYVDAFAPQIRWFSFPNRLMAEQFRRPDGGRYALDSPSDYARLCLDRWRLLTAGDPKPLILTGQAHWNEGAFTQGEAERKLRDFLSAWRPSGEVAGLNWWRLSGGAVMSDEMLDAIADARLGSAFQ